MRGEPITAAADSAAAGGGRGGRGGGGGGGGGRGGRGGQAVPGVPQPVPSAGYLPMNPCATPTDSSAAAGRGGGGGGGFGGGGGLGGPAPYVLPGTYTVALMSGTKVLDSKPLKIVFDPDVHFAAG